MKTWCGVFVLCCVVRLCGVAWCVAVWCVVCCGGGVVVLLCVVVVVVTTSLSIKKFAQLGANATCRQQWSFVSRLRRDVPSGGASAQGDASANDCTSSPHFVARPHRWSGAPKRHADDCADAP